MHVKSMFWINDIGAIDDGGNVLVHRSKVASPWLAERHLGVAA